MRLLTPDNFDGIVCAALLKEAGNIHEVKFVQPYDVQNGRVSVTKDDVMANTPYDPNCGMWFDHHTSEIRRDAIEDDVDGLFMSAKSCARVVFHYYGAEGGPLARFAELVDYADMCDSAEFSVDEILSPSGWVMLSFITDPRTGLRAFDEQFKMSTDELLLQLIDALRFKTIDEIMAMPCVDERVRLYAEHEHDFICMISEHADVTGDVLVVDLRKVETSYIGNRHLLYALFPEANISVRLNTAADGDTVFSVGHSILNRTSNVDVGKLMLRFGGGGLEKAGRCQVSPDRVEETLKAILDEINAASDGIAQSDDGDHRAAYLNARDDEAGA